MPRGLHLQNNYRSYWLKQTWIAYKLDKALEANA